MKEETVRTTVEEEEAREHRLDTYISEYLGLFSRSQVKKRVLSMELNGSPTKASARLAPGDRLTVRYRAPEPLTVSPEPIPLAILYEDQHVVVVNKPQGMVVHPGEGHYTGTLVHGLLHHIPALREAFPEEQLRPGIVHRLDKETSGVLIAAKDRETLESLAAAFASRRVEKLYIALVKGRPAPPAGRIAYPLSRDPHNRTRFTWKNAGGKEAETEYRVLRSYGGYSLVLLCPRTGRTHQLRVHMASQGTPILGDPLYSRTDSRFPRASMMLHALKLKLEVPEKGMMSFRAPPESRFARVLRELAGSAAF